MASLHCKVNCKANTVKPIRFKDTLRCCDFRKNQKNWKNWISIFVFFHFFRFSIFLVIFRLFWKSQHLRVPLIWNDHDFNYGLTYKNRCLESTPSAQIPCVRWQDNITWFAMFFSCVHFPNWIARYWNVSHLSWHRVRRTRTKSDTGVRVRLRRGLGHELKLKPRTRTRT